MTKKNYKLLENLYENKIFNKLQLTEAERAAGVAAAKAHYKLLADSGNKYGNLALEVVNNNGEWGKMANKHLEHQAVFEGINGLAVPTVRDNIIISLAHMDIIARKGDNIKNDLKAIGIYHKEVFRRQISEYAWGGLLFEEIKTGLWMDIYIKNEGRHDLASAVMQTTKEASKALSSGRLKTEYSIERMTQTMLYTAGRASGNNFTGNSTSFSKEGVAKSWGVDVSQVVLLDPYVGVHNAVVPFSKFIIKPANPLISKPTSSVIATPAPVVAESSEEQKTEHKQSSDSENNKISEDLVLRLNMLFSTPQSQSNSSSSLTPQVNSFSDLLTSLKAKSILDSALKEFRSKFDAILDKFHNKIKEELKTLAKEDNDLQQNNGQAEYDAKSQIILQKAQQAVSNMVQQQQLSYDSQVTAIAQQKKGECSAFFQQKSSEHAAEFGFQKMCAEISQSASTSGGCIVLDSSGIAAGKNAEVQAFNSQKQSELEMFQSNLKQQIDSQLKTMIAAKQLEAQAECIALKASIESRLNSNKSAQTNKIKTAVQKEKSKTEEFNNKVTDILSNSELLDRIKDALENNTNADIIATQELDVFLTGAEVDFGVS